MEKAFSTESTHSYLPSVEIYAPGFDPFGIDLSRPAGGRDSRTMSMEDIINLAAEFLTRGEYERAGHAFADVIRRSPAGSEESARAYFGNADSFFAQKLYKEALENYSQAAKVSKNPALRTQALAFVERTKRLKAAADAAAPKPFGATPVTSFVPPTSSSFASPFGAGVFGAGAFGGSGGGASSGSSPWSDGSSKPSGGAGAPRR